MDNKILKKIATGVLTATFLGSLGYLTWYHFDKPYNPLENVGTPTLVDSPTEAPEMVDTVLNAYSPSHKGTAEVSYEPENDSEMLTKYLGSYRQNNDLYAWINIPALDIDLPVMYTPNDYDWYLRKDYLGSYSVHGTLFTDLEDNFDDLHVIIYGHNMKDGTMFSGLKNYLIKEFFNQNPTFQVSDLYTEYSYEVIAVVKDKVHTVNEDCFKYYNYIGNNTSDYIRFADWLTTATNSRNLDQLTEGTKILMLSTCSYHTDNGRLIVVARRVEE